MLRARPTFGPVRFAGHNEGVALAGLRIPSPDLSVWSFGGGPACEFDGDTCLLAVGTAPDESMPNLQAVCGASGAAAAICL